jgi:hypothetical protein
MRASRILVNSSGTHGVVGLTSGLAPSMTLGCGTFGSTSTTDNVTYMHVLNIKSAPLTRTVEEATLRLVEVSRNIRQEGATAKFL